MKHLQRIGREQVLLLGIILLFLWVRAPSIWHHEVIFTYDQARDFLAGARIIIDKNPVFIGPTTGIGGLFHGAWWYYFTAVIYLFFGSTPINFYLALLLVHLISLISFYLLGRNIFGRSISLWACAHIALTDYFISLSLFSGNNVLAAPAFMLYCMILVHIFQGTTRINSKTNMFAVFIWGLSVGFVAEFELAFGIFLVPIAGAAFLFALLKRYIPKRNTLWYLMGIVIPFLPRVLFEAKNSFIQTRVLLSFLTKPKLYTPHSYAEVFFERLQTFRGYVSNTFGSVQITFLILCAGCAVITLFALSKIKNKTNAQHTLRSHLQSIVALFLSLVSLFVLSLTYRDTFWNYYFEGIQYGMLILCMLLLKELSVANQKMYKVIMTILIVVAISNAATKSMSAFNYKPAPTGLKVHESVVKYIADRQVAESQKIFCARVFVPPVIPYTYDYLWLHYYLNHIVDTPRQEYIDNKCWYIIEPEWNGFEYRRDEWKRKQIPEHVREIPGTRKAIYFCQSNKRD
jgi:hypothetical protein